MKLKGDAVPRLTANSALQCPYLTSCGTHVAQSPSFPLDGISCCTSARDGLEWGFLLPQEVFPAHPTVSSGIQTLPSPVCFSLSLFTTSASYWTHQATVFTVCMPALQGKLGRPTIYLCCLSDFPLDPEPFFKLPLKDFQVPKSGPELADWKLVPRLGCIPIDHTEVPRKGQANRARRVSLVLLRRAVTSSLELPVFVSRAARTQDLNRPSTEG